MASGEMSFEERVRARLRGGPSEPSTAGEPAGEQTRKREELGASSGPGMGSPAPGASRAVLQSAEEEGPPSKRSAESMAAAASVIQGTMSPAVGPGESRRALPMTPAMMSR